MQKALQPYLTYSFAIHFTLAAAGFLIINRKSAPISPIYTIDFVGPSASVISRGAAPQAVPAASPPKAAPGEEFNLRRKPGAALPKPSLTRNQSAEIAEPAAREVSGKTSGGDSSQAPGAGIATDMPNFPYPWYISQIRAGLWNQWSAKMPKQAGQAVVVFTLLRSGKLVDLRIESSSGDSALDLAAQAAVQDSAPFPPLPKGFAEPFLKIHVTLKSK